MSPTTVRREMRRRSKSTFKMVQVILISFSILFILIVSISVTYGFKELNQEEKNNDLILDPNEYFFNRATILTISVMTIMFLVLGIIAVISSSFCLLLFSGTSGSAIFLTQILILVIENVITPFTALILGTMVTVYGCAILYLAYKTNVYKEYHKTRATKLMEPTIVRRTSRSTSTTASSASTLNEHLTLNESDLFNSFSTFSDREELCSKEMPIASVDIGLVKIQK